MVFQCDVRYLRINFRGKALRGLDADHLSHELRNPPAATLPHKDHLSTSRAPPQPSEPPCLLPRDLSRKFHRIEPSIGCVARDLPRSSPTFAAWNWQFKLVLRRFRTHHEIHINVAVTFLLPPRASHPLPLCPRAISFAIRSSCCGQTPPRTPLRSNHLRTPLPQARLHLAQLTD